MVFFSTSISACAVLESTTRKFPLRFESMLPTPASRNPVTARRTVVRRKKNGKKVRKKKEEEAAGSLLASDPEDA